LKTLLEHGIFDGESYYYCSKLCSVASSLLYPDTTSLTFYISDLCFSYYNQWQLVIDAYDNLQKIHQKLNSSNSQASDGQIFSDYDLHSVDVEPICRDYAYLLVISAKSLLDLIACLVDATVYQTIRQEHQMVDFRSITTRSLQGGTLAPLLAIMVSFQNKTTYPWIDVIKSNRDRLIHRGYRIKPSFTFQKSEDLLMQMIKGNSPDEQLIEIGKLFSDFITGLPTVEDLISVELLRIVPDLNAGQIVELRYSAGGGVTNYHLKAL